MKINKLILLLSLVFLCSIRQIVQAQNKTTSPGEESETLAITQKQQPLDKNRMIDNSFNETYGVYNGYMQDRRLYCSGNDPNQEINYKITFSECNYYGSCCHVESGFYCSSGCCVDGVCWDKCPSPNKEHRDKCGYNSYTDYQHERNMELLFWNTIWALFWVGAIGICCTSLVCICRQ